jgi:hypothetical protein
VKAIPTDTPAATTLLCKDSIYTPSLEFRFQCELQAKLSSGHRKLQFANAIRNPPFTSLSLPNLNRISYPTPATPMAL